MSRCGQHLAGRALGTPLAASLVAGHPAPTWRTSRDRASCASRRRPVVDLRSRTPATDLLGCWDRYAESHGPRRRPWERFARPTSRLGGSNPLARGDERVEINPDEGDGRRSRRWWRGGHEARRGERAGRVSKDGIGTPHDPGNHCREVLGVVLGIVCRWGHVAALPMPSEVEEQGSSSRPLGSRVVAVGLML
jgi:hypothetical protein